VFAPLTNVRVVTIALNVPGPMAAARLRDLGAHVIKIEPPEGDPLKSFHAPWYARLAAGMTIETWDLKSGAGKERIRQLLSSADILLTSQRPAALTRLELGWDELHQRHPRLCQIAIVGYPAPDQNVAGHDLTYMAVNGLLSPPHLPRSLFADVATSEHAAFEALAVLLERTRTGSGQYREVALADTATRLAEPLAATLTRPGALLGGGFPGYNLYRSRDGWIALAALEPHFYRRLSEVLGIVSPTYEQLAERFAMEDGAHWLSFARTHDLPIAVVADAPPQYSTYPPPHFSSNETKAHP
jgi:alpha-methylacyl-CoA racemase